ncbi:type VI secretion system baseplate subunit TssE [Photorhabdus australis]|uniref:type VI secretion system baseplate subunit TssE n=2 Tax=Photorhabdus australis TaxID=286156 RepID=UPI00056C7C08|nr:type VI secretion system baseplate subunit TssE [Photorhabdus australis]
MMSRVPEKNARERRKSAVYANHQTFPMLLERLTESGNDREDVLHGDSAQQLRLSVLHNLQALLNCDHYSSGADLSSWPHVSTSTLNFGIRALAGKFVSQVSWESIECAIREAILHFEPRIMPQELTITGMQGDQKLNAHNILCFEIRGHLLCSSRPLAFAFSSHVDLENGRFELVDGG